MNDLYSSMAVDIKLDSRLVRYCGDFKAGVTVLDIIILVLLLLSAGAYSRSIIKAFKLAKVSYVYNYKLTMHSNSVIST